MPLCFLSLSYSSVFSSARVTAALLPFSACPGSLALSLPPLCRALFVNLLFYITLLGSAKLHGVSDWQQIRVALGDNIVPRGTDDGRRRVGE